MEVITKAKRQELEGRGFETRCPIHKVLLVKSVKAYLYENLAVEFVHCTIECCKIN